MIRRGEMAPNILQQCRIAWEALADFRKRRARSRNYYRNQPQEMMNHPESGKLVKEEDIITEQGRIPWHMNEISVIVRNMKGQFRENKSSSTVYATNRRDDLAGEMLTAALANAKNINICEDMDSDAFEELLVGGMYGWETRHAFHPLVHRPEIFMRNIDPARFFFNPGMTDRRLVDMSLVGRMWDVDMEQLIAWFAANRSDESYIRELYQGSADKFAVTPNPFAIKDHMGFEQSGDRSKCRVIEVWRREYRWREYMIDAATGDFSEQDIPDGDIARLNVQRMIEAQQEGVPTQGLVSLKTAYEGGWYFYYITPWGHVLGRGRTPYYHQEHPYTFGFGSYFDGEIWGAVEDLIDPQRLINRLTTGLDYLFAVSAKGVLMIPEDSIPDGMTPSDFSDEWTSFNGVIVYKARPGAPKPEQVTANSAPVGIFEWLNGMRMQIHNSSGVHDAQQGIAPSSNTPASLYHERVVQGGTNNRDFFDTFYTRRKIRDMKVLQLIGQYYPTGKYIPLETMSQLTKQPFVEFDAARVRGLEMDMVVGEGPDSPTTRLQMEAYLQEHLNNGRLTFRQYLQTSGHPKAQAILRMIEMTNPILANTTMSPDKVQGLVSELQRSAGLGDPDAAALLNQAA